MLGDGGGKVVEPDLTADSAEEVKSVDVAADEGFESLAVGELQVHLPAVGLDHTKAVKLARGAVVDQGAKVAPVDIVAFAGAGLDTNVGTTHHRVLPYRAQIVLDDGQSAVEAEGFQMLRDHRCVGVRVLLKQLGDRRFPGFDLMSALATTGFRRRRLEIPGDGAPADVELPGDL